MIEYKTAGESHGKGFNVIITGVPAGLGIKASDIDFYLDRRRTGYGRGTRVKSIEKDKVRIISGIRWGETIGSPVSFFIENRDWKNWGAIMSESLKDKAESVVMTKPRPGHADLPGLIKYGRSDIRDVLERASARETVARVASGAVCIKLLAEFGIKVHSFTNEIGGVKAAETELSCAKIEKKTADSPVRCPDKNAGKKMMRAIDDAAEKGDTLGGVFSVVVSGLPPGFGSYDEWKNRLDGRLAASVMAIPSVKAVEIGSGRGAARRPGSKVHDAIYYDAKNLFYRKTNSAGGIEGGVSNGMPVVVRAALKPIPSLKKPLHSVDVKTRKCVSASLVRGDVCVVPVAGVIGEAVVAVEIAGAVMEKTGGDCMKDALANYKTYLKRISKFWTTG